MVRRTELRTGTVYDLQMFRMRGNSIGKKGDPGTVPVILRKFRMREYSTGIRTEKQTCFFIIQRRDPTDEKDIDRDRYAE